MPEIKILVAEDNVDSRELVHDIISGLGYRTILVPNGQVALEVVRTDPPDLIILDINMPVMDGFEVCAAVKSDPATAEIPVIMLTAQTDIDSRVLGLGLGADDYVPKPFHPRELIARLQTRLRAKAETEHLREQREQIRRTFERFVAHEIVEQLLEDPLRVELGGIETIVTVLFADLEGFTPLAERIAPPRLLEVLNSYLDLLVQHIKANGGTVDKFIGDGVMALYNTPLPQDDHALRAVRTALDVRTALPDFTHDFEPQFRLGINAGIHTGPAVVGNIGTRDLMDFTAIGDTVNLANRLQGMGRGNSITVSEATYALIAEHIVAQRVGSRSVRGREESVVTYIVHSLRG